MRVTGGSGWSNQLTYRGASLTEPPWAVATCILVLLLTLRFVTQFYVAGTCCAVVELLLLLCSVSSVAMCACCYLYHVLSFLCCLHLTARQELEWLDVNEGLRRPVRTVVLDILKQSRNITHVMVVVNSKVRYL